LTFLDNRIFQTRIEGIADFALLGRTFVLAVPGRGLFSLSFERNELVEWTGVDLFPEKITGLPPDRLVTAHRDGSIKVWDSLEKKVWAFESGMSSLTALAVDPAGRIYGGDKTGKLRQWDFENGTARNYPGSAAGVRFLRYYPLGKLLAVEDGMAGSGSGLLRILDFAALTVRSIPLPPGQTVNGINVYHDGRIITATSGSTGEIAGLRKNLLVLSPGESRCVILPLCGHAGGTTDCLTMGPKIITCGPDADGAPSLRVWGSEHFVRTELSKLFIRP
jgi:WD40 repeat protein